MSNSLLSEVKHNNILNGESAVYKPKDREYWHYTSLSALLSIFKIKDNPYSSPDLTRCEMLASNICYLNDIKEFIGGVEDYEKTIERLRLSKRAPKELSAGLQDVSDDIYIVSFCGDGDLLSNWKYYAKDCGVSIQFNLGNVGFKYIRYKKDDIIADDWYKPIPVNFKDGDKMYAKKEDIESVFNFKLDIKKKSIKLCYNISPKSGYNELKIKFKEKDPWSGPIIVKINKEDNKDKISINKGSVSIQTNLLSTLEKSLGDGCVARTPIVITEGELKLNRDHLGLIDEKSKPMAVAYTEEEKEKFIKELMKTKAESKTVEYESVIKYIAIPCFKNQGFSEEKESRLLFYKYALNEELVFDFDYNTNNPIKIKPALRVQFLAKDSKTRLIDKIIVGPGENQNTVFNTLIHIFDRDNYKFYDDEKFKEEAGTDAIEESQYKDDVTYNSDIRLVKWKEGDKTIKRWSYKCANGIIIMKSSIPFRG